MKICLIGSTRFRARYEELNRTLSLAGHVVYSVAGFGHSGDTFTDEDKEVLDLVHLQKIAESDAVMLVTDETGYYGDSTRREILWAKMLGKEYYSSQFESHIQLLLRHLTSTWPVIRR